MEVADDGDISVRSDKRADSRIALFFLRPGQVATIMSAIESVTVQLSHGSLMGRIGPGTQPAGHNGTPMGVGPVPKMRHRAPAAPPVPHITPVSGAQAHPVAHILGPIGLAPPPAGAPGGSKGA